MKASMIRFGLAASIIAVTMPQTTLAQLKYSDLVDRQTQIITFDSAENVLIDNDKLRLSVTANQYTGGKAYCYNYKIAWNYKTKTKVLGSIAVNDKIVKSQAWTEYSILTDCDYTPGDSYKITFFSAADGGGSKLYEGWFNVPVPFIDNILP